MTTSAQLRHDLASHIADRLGEHDDDTRILMRGGATEEAFVGRFWGLVNSESDDAPSALFDDETFARDELRRRQGLDDEHDQGHLSLDWIVVRVDVLGSTLNSVDPDPFDAPTWPPPFTLRTCADVPTPGKAAPAEEADEPTPDSSPGLTERIAASKKRCGTIEALVRLAHASGHAALVDELTYIRELAGYMGDQAHCRVAELLGWYTEARTIAEERSLAGSSRDLAFCVDILERAAKACESRAIADEPPSRITTAEGFIDALATAIEGGEFPGVLGLDDNGSDPHGRRYVALLLNDDAQSRIPIVVALAEPGEEHSALGADHDDPHGLLAERERGRSTSAHPPTLHLAHFEARALSTGDLLLRPTDEDARAFVAAHPGGDVAMLCGLAPAGEVARG